MRGLLFARIQGSLELTNEELSGREISGQPAGREAGRMPLGYEDDTFLLYIVPVVQCMEPMGVLCKYFEAVCLDVLPQHHCA